MDDKSLLDMLFGLAARAGDAILRVRAEGFVTHAKADESPVTAADHAAEKVIVDALRAAMPDLPVVAEEEMAAGHVPDRAESYWLVDPLDGTKEFARGRDDFCVCIGLIRAGRPALGVIHGPVLGRGWGGIVGVGAWARDAAGERAIAVRATPAAGLSVLASRSHGSDPRLGPFLAGRVVADVRNMGSALKFGLVAEGAADLYPRFGPTMEWDTAAGQAIVEAAGGTVIDVATGRPLAYGKPGWLNADFYVTGRL
jgi:3'(2'), 5'-bisphosphate nucleotidase